MSALAKTWMAGTSPGHDGSLSAGQRLAKSRSLGIFLGAEPAVDPPLALIAAAGRQVVNAVIADRPQCQLGLDRASQRHRRVDAEQFFAVSVLVGRLTGEAEKPRAILIPSAQVARVCKASVPQSAPVLTCVSFLGRKASVGRRLGLD